MKLISSNPLANSGAAKEPVVNSMMEAMRATAESLDLLKPLEYQ